MPDYKNIQGGRPWRKHHLRCPVCHSSRIRYRSRTRDYRCCKPCCHHVWSDTLPKDYSNIPMQRGWGLYEHDVKRIMKFLKPGMSMKELALVTKIPFKTLQSRVLDLKGNGKIVARAGISGGRMKTCYYPASVLREQTQSINTASANI